MDLVLVTVVCLLGIFSLGLDDTVLLSTWTDSDVGISEQETDLLESLVLGLWEEEVRDDGVGDVGDDEDHEVLPAENIKTDRGDLTDDDVVEPVGSGRDGTSHSSKVHGEHLRLVDPRDGTEGPSESPREAEERSDTGNTGTKVAVAFLTELFTDRRLPTETGGHEDRTTK